MLCTLAFPPPICTKLQTILNAAARLIGDIPKFAHISAFIRNSLHWLPAQQRIQFKTLTLMRNCLTGSAPSYLMNFCKPVSSLPARASLRSSARGLMVVPRMHSSTAQSKSFAYVGPSAWNCVPLFLRQELLALSPLQFRRRLKTFLFASAGIDAG